MNISSVSASSPVTPTPSSPPKTVDATTGEDSSSTYQPTPPPPLPPGQGTRVDQIA